MSQYLPGQTVIFAEDYAPEHGMAYGDVATIEAIVPTDLDPNGLLHIITVDGVKGAALASRFAEAVYEEGDRVAVASPVYNAGRDFDHREQHAAVGDTGTVEAEADVFGDVLVRIDRTGETAWLAAAGLVYLGDTEATDEEVAEQEALDEAPSAADLIAGLEAILFPVADAEETEADEDEDDRFPEDLSRRADALDLAYDVLIGAATKAHEAGMSSEVDHDIVKDLARFILDEEGATA